MLCSIFQNKLQKQIHNGFCNLKGTYITKVFFTIIISSNKAANIIKIIIILQKSGTFRLLSMLCRVISPFSSSFASPKTSI